MAPVRCTAAWNPPLQASAGFKVYYTSGLQGEAPEVITIGKPETGARTGVCELGPADTVAWGANYDNNRCNPSGNQCRWGKLVL